MKTGSRWVSFPAFLSRCWKGRRLTLHTTSFPQKGCTHHGVTRIFHLDRVPGPTTVRAGFVNLLNYWGQSSNPCSDLNMKVKGNKTKRRESMYINHFLSIRHHPKYSSGTTVYNSWNTMEAGLEGDHMNELKTIKWLNLGRPNLFHT